MSSRARSGRPLTADGTNSGNFTTANWGLLLTVSAIWGSSFLWIEIGLDAFHPGTIACLRMVLGASVLWLFPSTRKPVDRSAWPMLLLVGIAGNLMPAVFFPLAQERVESSVAGMMNSVSPMIVLIISVILTRKLPLRLQVAGLLVGLVGAVFVALPNLSGADAQPLGVGLVMAAVSGYALSNNFLPPLAQAYGGPAVMCRAMAIAAVLSAPYGAWGIANSTFAWPSAVALLILGIVGTGFARAMFATLVGQVGAPRSAMVGYLVPVVAVILGVSVLGETVGVLELLGTGFILVGAFLISRGRRT